MKNLFWFRNDLRLSDNPALTAAASGEVMPIFILDDAAAGKWKRGGASRVWLHHSLAALQKSLGGNLSIYQGNASEIIPALCQKHQIDAVYVNATFEPWQMKQDKVLAEHVPLRVYQGTLLWDPSSVLKSDETPYKVFTPYFKRGCLSAEPPRIPLPKPTLRLFSENHEVSLDLLPNKPWTNSITKGWEFGEEAAQKKLSSFLSHGMNNYREGRDFPAENSVSRLSPHLHFGEISPNTVWHAIKGHSKNEDHFRSELAWREFSYYLLYHFPTLPEKNFQPKFDAFPWKLSPEHLRLWQQGKTGYPIVDAGMRELYQTGYMHNRVRMIVASFLIKNLLIDWREGEAWFWDTLFDADLANNSASWQWVAGSGADAAPYFRIFNPVTQSQKFDPNGDYIRTFVPELASLSAPQIHTPWDHTDYFPPIVDLKQSRELALELHKRLS